MTSFLVTWLPNLHIFGAYVSVHSKPDYPPRATPGDSHVLTAQGGSGFRSTLLAGGSGFRIREISCSFERKLREFLDLFQRNRKQLEKQVFLYCLISIFAKTVDDYCIFDNIYHFRPFWSF